MFPVAPLTPVPPAAYRSLSALQVLHSMPAVSGRQQETDHPIMQGCMWV